MPLATVYARALAGIDAPLVTIEVDIVNGLPSFSIVGLAETAVKEARHRVFGAIANSQFDFPQRKIIVSLSPADLPKSGGRFDLAIAIGILIASGQCPAEAVSDIEFHAELSLTGELRPAPGALVVAAAAAHAKRAVIMAPADAAQAAWVKQAECYAAQSLLEVVAHVIGRQPLAPVVAERQAVASYARADLADVRGQGAAKRALEVAASGGHGLLFKGPPGTGKTMLASRLPGLLPPLADKAALDVAMVQSMTVAGFDPLSWGQRPFRAPHHSASMAAIVGGGNPPRPGEISLAHAGVLFLDELPEFQRPVLEALREPLESGVITISRAQVQVTYPANMQWVAAMNPCPCGYVDDDSGRCHCTPEQIDRYQQRLSGPLLDRIDLHVLVERQPFSEMVKPQSDAETSASVRQRVVAVRELQLERCGCLNAELSPQQIDQHCELTDVDQTWFIQQVDKRRLSARRYHRALRVARTLADMAAKRTIARAHLKEALRYQG